MQLRKEKGAAAPPNTAESAHIYALLLIIYVESSLYAYLPLLVIRFRGTLYADSLLLLLQDVIASVGRRTRQLSRSIKLIFWE